LTGPLAWNSHAPACYNFVLNSLLSEKFVRRGGSQL
jgi:hypothetical protein